MPATISGALKQVELKRRDNDQPIEGVELLLLDTPSGCMVTLLNWVAPVTEAAVLTVHPTASADWTASSVQLGKLKIHGRGGHGGISVVLPSLNTVDVVLLKANRSRRTS